MKIRGTLNYFILKIIIILIKYVGFRMVVIHSSSDGKIVIGVTATIDKSFAEFTGAFSQAKTAEEYMKEKVDK